MFDRPGDAVRPLRAPCDLGRGPAGRIRPAAIRSSTFGRLIVHRMLRVRRGVTRWTNHSSPTRLTSPSIRPKHRATSTAPARSSDGMPVLFLAIRTQRPGDVSASTSSRASNAVASSKKDDVEFALVPYGVRAAASFATLTRPIETPGRPDMDQVRIYHYPN